MTFGAAIKRFNRKVQDLSDKQFRAACIELTNATVANTPVDTGRLRANWQPTFGSRPASGTVEWQSAGGRAANKAAASSAAAARTAQAANSSKDATEFYLSNNLDYAVAVETGNGRNRPRRMLARAILQVSRKL